MHGELAQIVALVAHGNPCLARRAGYVVSLDDNTTLRSARSVTFGEPEAGSTLDGDSPAQSVASWLAELRDRGGTRLALLTSDPFSGQETAGASGALAPGLESYRRWFLHSIVDRRATMWKAVWRVVTPRPSAGGLWHVRYDVADAEIPAAAELTLGDAHKALEAALETIRTFAAGRQMSVWAGRFEAALRVGGEPDPEIQAYPDLLPAGLYPVEARRVLAMSSLAWVFGQPGWWIDVSMYSSVTEAETYTRRLYGAVLDAVQAATNVE